MAYVRANSSCSACAKTSYTMASKSAVSSIISAISVGPAIWSIPTCPNKYFLHMQQIDCLDLQSYQL